MLITPHILVGIYLAFYFPPLLALPTALASHFLFDQFYPHWNPHIYTEIKKCGRISTNSLLVIGIDALLTALILFWISTNFLDNIAFMLTVVACATLAILPDIVTIPFFFFNYRNKTILKCITFTHKHQAQAGPVWGMVTQVIISLICLWQIALMVS
ncbi:MAG: hypothetical protein ACOX6V_00545 [Patescibacteria group bacterium]|jgi:ABC-type arginine transport system permease subunit